jgi:hypothetical protein
MACASFLVNLVVIGMAFIGMDASQWHTVISKLGTDRELSTYDLLVGFSSAWLAFSGLESISQLSRRCAFRCAEPPGGPWVR